MSKLGSPRVWLVWLRVSVSATALAVCAIAAAAEPDVELVSVTPGLSAELVISGGSPIRIDIGETIEGVTLVSADRRGAVVRVHGVTKTLSLVARRTMSGGGAVADSVTLKADPSSGHFIASGAVNGKPLQFVVDTGATLVAFSRRYADQVGIPYERGTSRQSITANGVVRGWLVTLDSVQVGNSIERNVQAIVVDNDALPFGLLGMSYLNRFDMQRNGSTLVLRRRR